MSRFLAKKYSLTAVSLVLSIVNLVVYHYPFFNYAAEHLPEGCNGVLIMSSLVVMMVALNFFTAYLLLYLGRGAGRTLLALFLILNSAALYFMVSYDVFLDDDMMGNVFCTNSEEANEYWSASGILCILFTGILPAVLLFRTKIDFGGFRRFLKNAGAGLAAILLVAGANFHNFGWVHNQESQLGALVLPWSYTVNTCRFFHQQKKLKAPATLLPDAHIVNSEKDVFVLVIGESARRQNFSLYGYERNTNPLLSKENGLTTYNAEASATYTRAALKAILDHKDTDSKYENLPDYLLRSGVDVVWRTSNTGEPVLKTPRFQTVADLAELYPECNPAYDTILYAGLSDLINSSDADKLLVVLHTSIGHGPLYNQKYPEEFLKFTPINKSANLIKCKREHVVNAYDNAILFADYVLHGIIGQLRNVSGRNVCMVYVSDHGESLGEDGVFMHGLDLKLAPECQYEIPFIVWMPEGSRPLKNADKLSHRHIFHSAMDFLDVRSDIYDGEMSIFGD